MAFGSYDGSIKIDSRIDTKGFNTGVKSMMGSLKGLAAAVGLAFGVGAVTLFGKSAVSAASDLASAMTGLKSVLDGTGKSFAQGRKFIDDYISDGLIPATNAITAYKNLALRGYSTEQIEKTLIALKDSAAFGRQSSYTLGQAVAGATEGLKNENSILVDNAGVTKNVAKMWEDYAESIGTTANNLTQQQKIQAEVNGILEETRFQTGDAAKLTEGYAGMVAALGTSFYNLKVAIGNILIPILSLIIPVVKGIVDGLVVLANQFAQVLSAVFGFKLGMSNAADDTKKAADQADTLADNTKKAEKAAKGALAAFDDLNVLQTGDDDPTSSTATPAVALPALNTGAVSEELGGLTGKVEGFMRRVQDLLQPTMDALGRLYQAVLPLGRTLWEGLEWAFNNILIPLGEWAVTTLLPAVIDVFTGAVNVLNAAIEALKPLGKWLWEEFLKPAGEWVGEAIITALGWLADRLNGLADWIKNNQQAFQAIVIVIGLFAAGWLLVTTALTAFNIIAAVTATLIAILTSPILLVVAAVALLVAGIYLLYKNWDQVGKIAGQVWDRIKAIWRDVATWFNDNVLKPLGEWFTGAWESIKSSSSGAWEWIKNAWKDAGAWFDDKVLQPLFRWFSRTWADIKGKASEAWDGLKEAWRNAPTWFDENILQPLFRWFSAAWTDIKGLASDAWDRVKGAWQDASTWFDQNVLTPLSNWFSGAWLDIKSMASGAWLDIKGYWSQVGAWFRDNVTTPIESAFTRAWDRIQVAASNLWATITGVFMGIGSWFRNNVALPIIAAFESAISQVGNAWRGILRGITDFVRSQINAVIGLLNGFISAIASAFNAVINAVNSIRVTIPSWVPFYGGNSFGVWIPPVYARSIPFLAQGGVIPPNSEFMAVLGDQRSGTNIETPERLLRQIMNEELGKIQVESSISFEGTLGALVRELKPYIDRETVRVGGSLIKGATS